MKQVNRIVLIRISLVYFLCLSAFAAQGQGETKENAEVIKKVEKEKKTVQPTPSKLVSDDSLLASDIRFKVALNGTITVSWKTRFASGRGRLHYGFFIPGQELDLPSWLGTVSEKNHNEKWISDHEAQFSATGPIEFSRQKTGKENGSGRIAIRIEILPRSGGSRFLDRVLGIRWNDGTFRRIPVITDGPFVCLPTGKSIALTFRTDLLAMAQVIVKVPQNKTLLFQEGGSEGTTHDIHINGLKPETTYNYQVVLLPSDDTSLSIYYPPARFHTSPGREILQPFSFAQLGGSFSGPGGGDASIEGVNFHSLRQLVISAFRSGSEFIIFPGDLVDGSTTIEESLRKELRSWKRAVGPVGSFIPIFCTAGSHESLLDIWSNGLILDKTRPSMEEVFADEFVNFQNGPDSLQGNPPYRGLVYSFDYANVHFVFLHTNYMYTNRPGQSKGFRTGVLDRQQLEWLKKDLSAARVHGARNIFAVGNAPGFPCGGLKSGAMYWSGAIESVNSMRNQFWKILSDAEVTAYLCSGESNYSRLLVDKDLVEGMKLPVWQIVSGGSGATCGLRDKSVPWAEKISKFSFRHHFCLYTVENGCISITVFDGTGGVIDKAVLSGKK